MTRRVVYFNGTLYSPEPRNILLGVSRDATMEFARELDIPVREVNLGRHEALQADEVFCTTTPFCLIHASTFEGQPVADGKPGPVFRKLMESWKRHVNVDFVAQAHSYAERLSDWEKRQG